MKARNTCLIITFFIYISTNGQTAKPFLPPVNVMPAKPVFNPIVRDTFNSVQHLTGFMSSSSLTPVSPLYYQNSLGFFCKKELQLEKAIRFPLKFRLGSVAYTDKMEGKTH